MRFPIIRVKDKQTDQTHIVGTDIHDELIIEDGQISYRNLQNFEGTGEFGDYEFVGENCEYEGITVEFVSFEELQKIYEEQRIMDEEAAINRKNLLKQMFPENDDQDEEDEDL